MPLPVYPPDLAGEWSRLRRSVRSTYTSSQRRGPLPETAGATRSDAPREDPAESTGPGERTHDVRSLGAVGDGVNDDGAVLQAALDRAGEEGGGVVRVPGGVYSVRSPPLRIHGNTRVSLAPDAVVRRDGGSPLLTNGPAGDTGQGNILLEGGVWDGNGFEIPGRDVVMSFQHVAGLTLRDTVVRDAPGTHAIALVGSRRVRLVGVRCEGGIGSEEGPSFAAAVHLGSQPSEGELTGEAPICSDVAVIDCVFTASETPGVAPWPTGVEAHGSAWAKGHQDVRILGCRFEGCSREGVRVSAEDGVVVQGNTFPNCAGGVAVTSRAAAVTAGTRPLETVIVENVFTDLGELPAVRLAGRADDERVGHAMVTGNIVHGGGGDGVRVHRARSLVCSNNLLDGLGGTGLHLDDVESSSVTANMITDVGEDGLLLVDVRNTAITANTLRGAGRDGLRVQGGEALRGTDNRLEGVSSVGVRVGGGITGLVLTGNRMDGTVRGLSIDETCRDVVRHGNDLRGSGGLDDASLDPVTDPADLV
jgi:hypothetical protein